MPTSPFLEPTPLDHDTEDVLADPSVQSSLEALDDPEDREDLLEALITRRRIADGKEKTYTLEEVKDHLGL
jgi:hypothetical protein